jgi:hypothetical protein
LRACPARVWNIAGFISQEAAMAGKWLELLTEIAPGVKRAGSILGFTSELELGTASLQRYLAGEENSPEFVAAARTAANDDLSEAVHFIRASTTKMDRLINAILNLSREGRRGLHAEPVDLGKLFDSAAAAKARILRTWWRALSLPPLEWLLGEIERALQAQLYYLALMLTLALPDICAALGSQDGRSSSKLYKNWYDANMATKFTRLTGDDCYSLRCGVVHQGQFGVAGAQYARVVFALPTVSPKTTIRNGIINCRDGQVYIYSVEDFCHNVIEIVRTWFATNKDDPTIKANIPRLVRVTRLRDGFPGLSVIA